MATSCSPEKKDTRASEEGVNTTIDEVVEVVEEVVAVPVVEEKAAAIPEVSLDDLAKKTGFAQHVSADVEGYFSLINGNDLFDRVLGSELGQLLMEASGGGDAFEGPEAEMARAALGEELVMAFGNTAGEQGAYLTDLNSSRGRAAMKFAVEMMAMSISGEDMMGGMQMNSMMAAQIGDPKKFIDIMEGAVMPPITVGIKVSDEDMRADLANMIEGGITQALQFEMPFIEELALEKSGVQFSGFTILGEKLSELMVSEGDDAAEFFGGEVEFQRLAKAVASKNLHVAAGVYGDYILVYVGGRMEDFKLAESTADSFLAEKDASFLKRYADKDLRLITYAEKESLEALTKDQEAFGSMLLGIKDGLEEVEVFGDTRDIETLLEHAAKTEKVLLKMGDYTAYGAVGFIEDGFKIESHGGTSSPGIDFEATHRFSSLENGEDVAIFANSASDPEFSAKALDYLNSLGEAAYLMGKQVSGMDDDDGDMAEFQQAFGLFDQLAAKEMADIWDALIVDFSEGTGTESALIVDLKGTFPKVPDVPAVVLEKGVLPRVAFVLPVTDRAKVGKSWKRINGSLTKVLANAKEAGLFDVPMQEPIESKDGDFSTYFFSIPAITKNANPNVSISDDLFIASSSPAMNSELTAALAQPATTARKGAYAQVNFGALQAFAESWVKLAKENPDEIFKDSPSEKEDFMESLPMIEKSIAAMNELKNLTMHTRKLDGEVRSTIHFKTK